MPSDDRIEGVLSALRRERPGVVVERVPSPYNRRSTMLRVWAANRNHFDLFRRNGIWQVASSQPGTGLVPVALKTASDPEVAHAFLWNFGRAVPDLVRYGSATTREVASYPAAAPLKATQSYPAAVPATVVAVLLLIATLPLDYGYYPFLRLTVTAASIWVAVIAHSVSARGWMIFSITMAVLFNPLFPVYGVRAFWVPVDVVAALAFGVAAFALRRTRLR